MGSSPPLRNLIFWQTDEIFLHRRTTLRKEGTNPSVSSPNPRLDYRTVTQEAQGMGDSARIARGPVAMASSVEKYKEKRLSFEAKRASIEILSAEGENICGEDASSQFLALTNSYTPPGNRSFNPSSPFSRHQATLPPTPETRIASRDPLTPSRASVYYTPPPSHGRPLHCRLCPGPHVVCTLVAEADRDRLTQVREKNF